MNEHNNPLEIPMRRFVRFLIEPPPGITGIRQKWQARLLSSLLLIMILLGSTSALIRFLTAPEFRSTFPVAAAVLAMLTIAYALTRARRYVPAVVITCIVPSLASFIALVTNPREQAAFGFMLFGVFLSSVLLNGWFAAGIAALNLIGLLTLPLWQPAWTSSELGGIFVYQLILPVLMITAAWNRDLLERDRQQELSESELKFRSIFDNSVDAIGVSRMGTHTMVNPAYLRMFGYDTADPLIGNSILDLIAPSHRTQIVDYVQRRAAGGNPPGSYETRGLRRDGTEFDLEVHVSTYELAGQLYTVPILRDVSQRKQTEEALRASEVRYRAIVESTTDLICRFLPDTTLTYVNEAYCRYFGQSREQLTGAYFLTLIPETDWAEVQNHLGRVVRDRQPVTYSHQVTTPGGEIRWQQWTDSVILDENGEVVELQSVGRDITEQVLAERSLQESERRFREMLEGVSLAGVMLDPAGEITFINDFLLSITRWRREDALSRNWFDLFLPSDTREDVRVSFGQLITSPQNKLPHFENEILTAHGERRLIRWSNTLLFDANGNINGTASIGEDITERKRGEEMIRRSEERFREMAENIHEVFYLSDLATPSMLYISPAYEIIWGRSCQSLYENPTSFLEAVHPEDVERVLAYLERQRQVEGAQEEYRVIRPDGTVRWVWDRAVPVRGSKGQAVRMCGVVEDITERKQIERELDDNRRRLAFLMAKSPAVIYSSKASGDFGTTFVSDNVTNQLGYQPEDFIRDPGFWTDRIHPDDASRVFSELEKFFERGVHTHEYRFRHKNGQYLWMRDELTLIRDATGEPSEIIGCWIDITKSKQAERALRVSEARYRSLIDSQFDAIARSDLTGRLTFVNDAYCRVFGRSRDELIGHVYSDMVFPEDQSTMLESQEALILPPHRSQVEIRSVTSQGIRWFSWLSSAVTDETGGIIELQGVGRDITERKQAEERLRLSEERYRTLAKNLPDSALLLYDRDLRFMIADGPEIEAAGFSKEMLEGKTLHEALPPDFIQLVEPNMRRTLAGETCTAVLPYEDRFYRYSYVPIRDHSGEVDLAMILATNFTQLKRTEDALKESQKRLSTALRATKVGVWEWDLRTDTAYWSPENYGVMGLEPGGIEARYENWANAVHPEDLPAAEAKVAEAINGKGDLNIEFRVIWPDGSIHWINDIGDLIVDDDTGQPIGMFGIQMDITERKRAEEALKENEVIFSSFLEHSPVYVFFKDRQIRSLRLSRNYEEMLGMPIQDLLGKSMDELFPSDLAKSMVADDLRILHEGNRISVVEELNGRTYETTKFPVFKDGEPFILAGFTVDITERKQAEDAIKYAERRYRALFEEAPVMYVITSNNDGTPIIADCNNMFVSTLGYSRAEVAQQPLAEFYTSASRSELLDGGGYQRALRGNFTTEERELLTRDGRVIRTLLRAIPEIDSHGKVRGTRAMFVDITERKRMEELLFEEKERAEITLHSIGDAVITTDVNAVVEYLNPVAEHLTGWAREEAIGQPLETVFRIVEEGSRQPALSPVQRCLELGQIVGLVNHSILIRRDGREFSIDDSAAPIRNRSEEMIGVVLVFHDVTEERRLSQQVAHDAMHDSLTGLVNRREFERRLERALINTKEYNVAHILCYLDLDQFKIVNDTAGHAAGDELLRQISGLLAGLFRQRDTLARLGGDEFGLLLENCQLDQALVIANEIKAKIRGFPFIWAGRGFQVGVSIGVVPITAEKESVNLLLSQADVACYSAKDLGRDRIHVYQAEDSETTQRHGEIMQAARMRDAIFHNQFQLFCQPIVRVGGEHGDILQYEVLLRMADGEERLVLPSAFIPSAERYGLMPAIDRWVIRETLVTMAQHNIDNMLISINLSGNSLDDETLLDYVLEQLDMYSIAPRHICFEITETAAIHHLSKAQQFIRAFRERGGQIALDDFGSGFSSFRYLRTLPVDYIKIDGSFVSDMLSNPGDVLMVEAMTKIAHTLGIRIIAEHAPDSETIARLREIGVDYAQGFGTGIPVSVQEAWSSSRRL